jgi:hypothetical protein
MRNFVIIRFRKHYWGDQISEDRKGEACSMYGTGDGYKFWSENLKARDDSGDLDTNGKIILE